MAAPPGPVNSKAPVPNYSLRDLNIEEQIKYLTFERNVPKQVAVAAVKIFKKNPEMLAICIFAHEQPEGVETAADCKDRMGR